MKVKDNFLRKDWLMILMLLVSLGAAIYFYPALPERVPSHWNIYGEIDGYSSRFFGAFGIPILNIGMYVLFLITPYLDPKKANYKFFEGSYRMFRVLIHVFMIGMQAVILAAALGYSMNVAVLVKIGVSMLFILIGNVMGRFKYNYFIGVKTPWTLANEEVWKKTHRMAAPVWVIGGAVCLISSLWNNVLSASVFLADIFALAVVPVIYSYVEYRKCTKCN